MTNTIPCGQTGISVTAKFFPLMWILYIIKPTIVIDGVETKSEWKTPTFFPTSPGAHQVGAYFPYFIPKKAGKGSASVTVAPGQVVNVTYKAPSWVVFRKGKMIVS